MFDGSEYTNAPASRVELAGAFVYSTAQVSRAVTAG